MIELILVIAVGFAIGNWLVQHFSEPVPWMDAIRATMFIAGGLLLAVVTVIGIFVAVRGLR